MPSGESPAIAQLVRAAELEIVASQRADGGSARKANLNEGALIGAVGSGGSDGSERREYRYACRSWPPEFDALELMVRPTGSSGLWTAAEITLAPGGGRRVVVPLAFPGNPPNLQVREDRGHRERDPGTRLEDLAAASAADLLDAAADRLGRPAVRGGRAGRPEREVVGAVGDAGMLILARDGDQTRLGPKSLGPAGRFILDHTPCPVLLIWPGSAPDLSTLPPAPPHQR